MEVFSKHAQWPQVLSVCKALQSQGYIAWLAGGCVRDGLLGIAPNDFDIATDALPEQVEALFPKSIAVGKKFGVITLPFDGFQIEVATFRKDENYQDGRRPEGVVFSAPEEDAQRRDFTVNGMFYDPKSEKVHDYVGGGESLRKREIKSIGTAEERFEEDQLRILRAARFAAQLDFQVECETFAAMKKLAPKIKNVSIERIKVELEKAFCAKEPELGLQLLESAGVLDLLLPSSSLDIEDWKWGIHQLKREANQNWTNAFFWALLLKNQKMNEVRSEAQRVSDLQNMITKGLKTFFQSWKFSKKQSKEIVYLLVMWRIFKELQSFREGEVLRWLSDESAREALISFQILSGRKVEIAQLESGAELPLVLPEALLSGEDVQQELQKHSLKNKEMIGALLEEAFLLQLEGCIVDRMQAKLWLEGEVRCLSSLTPIE